MAHIAKMKVKVPLLGESTCIPIHVKDFISLVPGCTNDWATCLAISEVQSKSTRKLQGLWAGL